MKLEFKDFCKDDSRMYMADLVLLEGDHTEGHCHDFYEFFVVLEGEFIHYYGDKLERLTKGMCRFVMPDTFHKLHGVEGSGISRLRNIATESMYMEKLLEPMESRMDQKIWKPTRLGKAVFEQFQYKTDKIMRYYDPKMTPYIVKSIVMDCVVNMIYESEIIDDKPKWLSDAYIAMEQENLLDGGLPTLLELCGKSQEHITRAFKKYYGTTPTEYINTLRLNWSCRLLTTTKLSILDIAYTCGFNTIAYYNRRFKEKYECTPSQYREIHHKTFY